MSAFPEVSPEAPSTHPVEVGVGGTPRPSKGIFIARPSSSPPHPHLPLCGMEGGTEGHRTSLGSPPLQGLKAASRCGMWGFLAPATLRAFLVSSVPRGHPVRKAPAPSAPLTFLATSPSLPSTSAPASILPCAGQNRPMSAVQQRSCSSRPATPGQKDGGPERAATEPAPNPGADSQARPPSARSAPACHPSGRDELTDGGAGPGRGPLPLQ